MINLKKKNRWEWKGWQEYFLTGIATLVVLMVAGVIVACIVAGFIYQPIITSCIFGFFVLAIPIGYITVHVFGVEDDKD